MERGSDRETEVKAFDFVRLSPHHRCGTKVGSMRLQHHSIVAQLDRDFMGSKVVLTSQ